MIGQHQSAVLRNKPLALSLYFPTMLVPLRKIHGRLGFEQKFWKITKAIIVFIFHSSNQGFLQYIKIWDFRSSPYLLYRYLEAKSRTIRVLDRKSATDL